MRTQVWRVEPGKVKTDAIKKAAHLLRNGGLVAFPTETVYGLGANGLDPGAIAKIFKAKGRPLDNPLILHIAEPQEVYGLAENVSLDATTLMKEFWPGPLTLVLPRKSFIPDEATAGLDTVAIRMPAHPVALALIKEAGIPVAAPSANRSGYPSPTTAFHVLDDLNGKIDAVLDAGPTGIGLESTVLDLSGDKPLILRPGGVTKEELEGVIGAVEVDRGIRDKRFVPKSPGMKYTHYSPKAQVILISGEEPKIIAEKVSAQLAQLAETQKKVGLLLSSETWAFLGELPVAYAKNLGSRSNLESIAYVLYGELRRCDQAGADIILTETYKDEGLGMAIMNRLLKSAGYRVV
jgi:L-threonylcarbamoyladenylate synthase